MLHQDFSSKVGSATATGFIILLNTLGATFRPSGRLVNWIGVSFIWLIPWISEDVPVGILHIKGDEPETQEKSQPDLSDCQHLELEGLNETIETT